MSDSGEMMVRGNSGQRGQVTSPETHIMSGPPSHRRGGEDEGDGMNLPFDPWRLLTVLKRRWLLLLKAGIALGFAGAVFGFLKASYHVNVTLISRGTPLTFVAGTSGESFKPQQLSSGTLANMIRDPSLMRRVAAKSDPAVSEGELSKRVMISMDRESAELLTITMSGQRARTLVDLANLFASEAVRLTKEEQVRASHEMNNFLQHKLIAADKELQDINNEIVAFMGNTGLSDPVNEGPAYMSQLSDVLTRINQTRIDAKMVGLEIVSLDDEMVQQSPAAMRLQAAKDKLNELLANKTEAHPDVIAQHNLIRVLENMMNSPSTNRTENAGNPIYQHRLDLKTKGLTLDKQLGELEGIRTNLQEKIASISVNSTRYNLIKTRLDSAKESRTLLASRQREAQLYEDNAEGYYRVYSPATLSDVNRRTRFFKAFLGGFGGLVLGVLFASGFVMVAEIFDDRLKTAADVERVTQLKVLVSLGDLDRMSAIEKEHWAFHAWTALSGQLTTSPNHGMVCGFISSTKGEGRTTWINLLVSAASQRGLRVLTVATRPSAAEDSSTLAGNAAAADEKTFEKAVAAAMAATKTGKSGDASTLSPQVLAFPAEVEQKLTMADGPPVAHIPLPGWVWNLERRKQWQTALTHWRTIDNLVLLVELPPASMPESVLLAENLPQLVWLVDSGKAHARETKRQLKTLRYAKCRLVGAVLNHEPKPVFEL